MRHDIAFLHTAAEHVATFDELAAELAPDLRIRHDVAESLLAEARKSGSVSPALERRVGQAMLSAASSGARVVVCTCSTIGSVAEGVGSQQGLETQRIDRAMADAAVNCGSRILVVAALPGTVSPTCKLIASSASKVGKSVSMKAVLVKDAWPYFERSMTEAYLAQIAAAVKAGAGDADVIVLAQASMAGAVGLCRGIEKPVLASPRLGFEAAIAAFRRTL